jgi:hypothetical protein
MTTTTAVTWPSAVELADVQEQLSKTRDALERLHFRFGTYKREMTDPEEWGLLPDDAQIGELTRFLVFAEYDVGEMVDYLEKIDGDRKSLAWLMGEHEERKALRRGETDAS